MDPLQDAAVADDKLMAGYVCQRTVRTGEYRETAYTLAYTPVGGARECALQNVGNRLIDSLGSADRANLLAAAEPVRLRLAEVLYEPGQASPYVYFPTEGFASLIASAGGQCGVEVGMVGSEGMVGSHLAHGIQASPVTVLVQGAGVVLRISAADFTAELACNAALRALLHRYQYVLTSQLTTSSACLRYHHVGPRLARWLLMYHDRVQADTFAVTHEFLAHMLGVRRVGITTSAMALQRLGCLSYRRGTVTVLDRAHLESQACSCYEKGRLAYRDFLF